MSTNVEEIMANVLGPIPEDACQTPLFLTTRQYCRRPRFGTSLCCYWHSQERSKYRPELIESHFGTGWTLVKVLEREVSQGGSLESAYLSGAPLRGSFLTPGANIRGAVLPMANLAGAGLSYAKLNGANLLDANLEYARLGNADLTNTNLFRARLFNVKLRNTKISGATGLRRDNFQGLRWGWLPLHRILEEYPEQAEGSYRQLSVIFATQGLLDDASWAAYRSCVMRHQQLAARKSYKATFVTELGKAINSTPPIAPPKIRVWIAWFMAVWAWLRSAILDLLIGYGEKPLRAIVAMLIVIVGYAAAYHSADAISDSTIWGSLYFSLTTFATLGFGDVLPRHQFRILAASESLFGVFLAGLFLFCLGRRSIGRV